MRCTCIRVQGATYIGCDASHRRDDTPVKGNEPPFVLIDMDHCFKHSGQFLAPVLLLEFGEGCRLNGQSCADYVQRVCDGDGRDAGHATADEPANRGQIVAWRWFKELRHGQSFLPH